MIAKVTTIALTGFDGALVEVEVDAKQGLPGMHIVGMGNKAVEEARERVRSAIAHSLLDFPIRKLVVNLAPAELPKEGAHYDLPIALSVLVASGQLKQIQLQDAIFAGELSLDGSLRPIRGVITIVEAAMRAGFHHAYVPVGNITQAQLVQGIRIMGVATLKELFLHLKGEATIPQHKHLLPTTERPSPLLTIDEIQGQVSAKRALQIAAAGRHNLLLIGPPGAGKTMLARVLTGLLPPLSNEEQLAVTKIHSIAGEREAILTERPFRAPHHSTTATTLIGGGAKPKPGEVSLAHLGVLFLDELPEFARSSLESLRQPLEDRMITLTRTSARVSYPADFMLIATMNPCPCGFRGDQHKICTCSATQIDSYRKKISGPLIDRIDLVLHVKKLNQDDLLSINTLQEKQHTKVFEHIMSARKVQIIRYDSSIVYNASLSSSAIKKHLKITPEARKLLLSASERLGLTTRGYFKIIKVAQTIADLEMDTNKEIRPDHIAEALQYRVDLSG